MIRKTHRRDQLVSWFLLWVLRQTDTSLDRMDQGQLLVTYEVPRDADVPRVLTSNRVFWPSPLSSIHNQQLNMMKAVLIASTPWLGLLGKDTPKYSEMWKT